MTDERKNEDIALRFRCYEFAQKNIPLAVEYYKFVMKSACIDDYDLRLRCLDIERGRKIEEVEILFAFLTQDILDA